MLGKQLVHDRLVLFVPYQGGGRVALVLVHQSDEAFRLILVHFTFERLSRRRKFVGIAGVAFAVPHFQQIVHHLTQPVPYVETGSATSETAFRIAVAQPDDCIQDTCLERIERDFLRSEWLSRTVPVGGEEGVGGLVVPYRPLKRAGGGTFDILMGITVIFDIQLLYVYFQRVELHQGGASEAGTLGYNNLLSVHLRVVCSYREEALLGTHLAFRIIHDQFVGVDTYLVIIDYSHINRFIV